MEFVFVVRRSELFPEFYPHGLVPFGAGLTREGFERVIEERGFFVERAFAEHDPSLKQIIPYAVVVRAGEVLLLKRSRQGGDARLFDKLSIGVGGHVNPVDALVDGRRIANPLVAGTQRELGEELAIQGSWTVRTLGLLNDDSNSVGAVHVGVVQVVHVEGNVEVQIGRAHV
jgi:predicted NUDIX family phosphoesterase